MAVQKILHIQGFMVLYSRPRQCILTAVSSLYHDQLDEKKINSIYQLFYLNYIASNIETLLGYTIKVMLSILKLYSSLHMKLIYQSMMIYA